MPKILGISAFFHDSAAAVVIDGEIISAAQEERFTREKHTSDFPTNAIKYCLEEAGLTIDELDAISFYDKPLLKFERLLETYYAFSPKGLFSFLKAIPIWLSEKLFIKKQLLDGLNDVGDYNKRKIKFLFPEHHVSHISSAFFPSPFKKAAILTIDGVGEWCTAAIGIGENTKITIKKELHFPHSVGLLYSAFTYYLGFKVNSGEYKMMGLAPYGNEESKQVQHYSKLIKSEIVDIKEDGSIWLNQSYFNYAIGLKMVKEKKWEKLFGFERRKESSPIETYHCNLALAIQKITEEIILKMAIEAKKITGLENLCMAGGVALNCVANGVLIKKNIFKRIYIQPASGDAGGALGAALASSFIYFDSKRNVHGEKDPMNHAYLGPEYSDKEILLMNRKMKAVATKYVSFDKLSEEIASKIATGNIIGWFQGRMEFGPRALGNRSILANPSYPEMQKKLNLKVKKREGFRPFASSILDEDVNLYFDFKRESPFMLVVAKLLEQRRKKLPDNYLDLYFMEKLYCNRSDLQAITHLDFSSRIHTVTKKANPKFRHLLESVKKQTGHGILINTSFNVRGEPIVCSPLEAYKCFMNTNMDYLVIHDFVYIKKEQPNWNDPKKWQIEFLKD